MAYYFYNKDENLVITRDDIAFLEKVEGEALDNLIDELVEEGLKPITTKAEALEVLNSYVNNCPWYDDEDLEQFGNLDEAFCKAWGNLSKSYVDSTIDMLVNVFEEWR